MRTDTILNGILALLVAQRDATAGPTGGILADAGLSDEHIALLGGRDSARTQAPVTAFGASCVERASAHTRKALSASFTRSEAR